MRIINSLFIVFICLTALHAVSDAALRRAAGIQERSDARDSARDPADDSTTKKGFLSHFKSGFFGKKNQIAAADDDLAQGSADPSSELPSPKKSTFRSALGDFKNWAVDKWNNARRKAPAAPESYSLLNADSPSARDKLPENPRARGMVSQRPVQGGEVAGVMNTNKRKLQENIQELKEVEGKSDELSQQAEDFSEGAAALRRHYEEKAKLPFWKSFF